jgi:asparagine synthase (glutamine-hydrolysing)
MCGIAGIYAPNKRADTEAVSVMLAAMAHRGPDDTGRQVLSDGELALGHLRLSIIDLSTLGHQPMATYDRRTWIIFNGEIYNFRQLRSELQALGCHFRSDSDTEVILAAYQQWGLAAVERFHGMFAFALWDDATKVLHLCRDRFGVKPLYYSVNNGTLAFASESKALNLAACTRRVVDPLSVAEFVQYGYISAPRSIFADVRTVRPATICSFGRSLQFSEKRYWSAHELFSGPDAQRLQVELGSLPDEELLDRVESSLQLAFEYRMVADVPVGLFLSGGIDSSLVAAVLTRRSGFKLKTFTIGYGDSEFDERVYARTVARTLGSEHTELVVSPQTAVDTVSELPSITDEPIGDSSLIPTVLVSRLARNHVTVALSADGADELFGGYARYDYCAQFLERRSRFIRGLYSLSGEILSRMPGGLIEFAYSLSRGGGPKFAAISDKLRKFVRMTRSKDSFDAYDAIVSEWTATQRSELVGSNCDVGAAATFNELNASDVRNRLMYFDIMRYLPGDLLTKVDRASMSISLEAREPFLDQETARIAAALPMRWKIRAGQNKYVLRRLLARYFEPSLFDRPKQGFSVPLRQWLSGPLREMLMQELSASRVREFGLLDPNVVDRVLGDLAATRPHEASPSAAWIILQLQQWAAHWLTGSVGRRAQAPSTEALWQR